MRWLSLLVLVSLTAGADDRRGRFERFCGRSAQGRSSRGFLCDDYAFFEFAPASGAGLTSACSTTPPTGAKGEALSFARTGNATCTRTATGGLATTGIANGDLVVMSANQPRVEYDSAGTLGLLVESARTNSLIRSEALDNAAWTSSTGAGAVTVTADYAAAPDGTLTADRLQVAACPTAGLYSARLQSRAAAISTDVGSVYLKGTSGSGSVGIMLGGAATYWAATCTFNASTWTRCSTPAGAIPAASEFWIGCLNNSVSSPNPGNTGAADVLVWGAQDEVGAYATSYIPTTSAAVTRNVESADFIVSVSPTASTGLSTAATVTTVSTATWVSGGGWLAPVLTSGSAGTPLNGALYWWTYVNTGPSAAQDSAGVVSAGLSGYFPGFATLNATSNRVSASHSGSAWTLCQNGSCATSGSSTLGTPAFTRIMLGNPTNAAANQNDKIVSRICIDPSPTRCR
ncbi:MAG: hypothetical protein IPQ23_22405 [Cytophagaceae bacterium]|nr:hypothetical protein [Cytophagaceae bacterium]